MEYIKLNSTWNNISNKYKKINNSWIKQNSSFINLELSSIALYNSMNIGIDIPEITGIMVIGGPLSVVGETCEYILTVDGNEILSGATWSITSGNTYASISNSGLLTILSTANNSSITISVSYNGNTQSKNINVTYKGGTTSSSTSSTETHENEDGSISVITTTTTTDQNGNTTVTINTITQNEDGTSTAIDNTQNSDGSSITSTINYDENNNPTSASNNTIDTSGNSNTQNIIYDENGNSKVVGYTIDTSNNNSGGETLSSEGIDTGMIVFDNNDWEAVLEGKFPFVNASILPIITCCKVENNKRTGIYIYARTSQGAVYNEKNTQISTTTQSPALRIKINKYNDGNIDSNSADFYSGYDSTNYSRYIFGTKTNPITLTFKLVCKQNIISSEIWYNGSIIAMPRYKRTYGFNSEINGITFELGILDIGSNIYKYNYEILSFDIHKI